MALTRAALDSTAGRSAPVWERPDRGAARQLLDGGHEVLLHARNSARAGSVDDLARRAAGVVVGDLVSAEETRGVADQVNAIGGIDTVIHNAAVHVDPRRVPTPEGHARTLAA